MQCNINIHKIPLGSMSRLNCKCNLQKLIKDMQFSNYKNVIDSLIRKRVEYKHINYNADIGNLLDLINLNSCMQTKNLKDTDCDNTNNF